MLLPCKVDLCTILLSNVVCNSWEDDLAPFLGWFSLGKSEDARAVYGPC
jgi:hypothetical protein